MSFAMDSNGGQAAQMNVTPLIDVLLVLLVIFMIITPTEPRGLYTEVSQDHGKPASNTTPVILQLTQGKGSLPVIAINRKQLAWADVGTRLLEIYKVREDGVLFIKADRDIDFEYVAQAIDKSCPKISRMFSGEKNSGTETVCANSPKNRFVCF